MDSASLIAVLERRANCVLITNAQHRGSYSRVSDRAVILHLASENTAASRIIHGYLLIILCKENTTRVLVDGLSHTNDLPVAVLYGHTQK